MIVEFVFFLSVVVVFYTYLGYPILLYLLTKLFKKRYMHPQEIEKYIWPKVSFLVAAYNEAECIFEKLKNCASLDYPEGAIEFLFVTDGSTDETEKIIRQFLAQKTIRGACFHATQRKGKIAAIQRIIPDVSSPIIIFSDANTLLNPGAIKNMVRYYNDPAVGAVAGEKRVLQAVRENASGAGESMYWKYESTLKKWDAQLYSVVGAAGELFSVRTDLYEMMPEDTVIEDFYLTLRIAQNGYRVAYEPDAYAQELSSANTKEELKRKVRIAAGGIQAIIRLAPLLNVFRFGLLSFQYFSHRVLRWTLAPPALLIALLSNCYLSLFTDNSFYHITFWMQIAFYALAMAGFFLESRKIRRKVFFVPYYFTMMHLAVFKGIIRYFSGRQAVTWERARRKKALE